jgi:hypothetical protein
MLAQISPTLNDDMRSALRAGDGVAIGGRVPGSRHGGRAQRQVSGRKMERAGAHTIRG